MQPWGRVQLWLARSTGDCLGTGQDAMGEGEAGGEGRSDSNLLNSTEPVLRKS